MPITDRFLRENKEYQNNYDVSMDSSDYYIYMFLNSKNPAKIILAQ